MAENLRLLLDPMPMPMPVGMPRLWLPIRDVQPINVVPPSVAPIVMQNNAQLAAPPSNLPPSPQITQTLVGTPDGFQFSFNQVTMPRGLTNVITAYRVYRNTQNVFGQSLIHTFVHDPRHFGAIVFTDTIMANSGLNYYYWVTSVDSTGKESLPQAAQAGTVASNVGSTPYSNTGHFSYTSTTSSITWSWTGLAIYRADGTITNIADGSQLISGLSASTTYQFLPYWDEVLKSVGWVAGGSGTPAYALSTPTQAQLAQQNYRTRIPLSIGGMSASTPSGGSGGGSGGGGGGGGGGKFV